MPLSPPPSRSDEMFQHDLHHLIQHNSNTSYPQQNYEQDEAIHVQSYASPVHDDTYRHHKQNGFPYQHQHQDSGLGIQYDSYNQDYQGSTYTEQYGTPATSPPTPSMNSQELLRTRSGLGIQRNLKPIPEGRTRTEKSPKMKKVKKEKVKAEKKVAKLERPLSELTKHWKHVPVADIETYVNRSAEDRRKEVEEGKIPGKVKRPMNSFMLYRKAYQNRTKDWCLQNNHQVVSQVCGDSWPLEADEVKEQFSEWARIERINHQNAFPGYKFSPQKPGTAKPPKRKQSVEPDSDQSDLDDFDWQGSRKPKRARTQTPRPVQQQTVDYPTTQSAYSYGSREQSMEPYGGYNKSAFQYVNPGIQPPAQYNQAAMQAGTYYQQTVHPHPSMQSVEDVIVRKIVAPGIHSHLGLPGGQEYDMMNQDMMNQQQQQQYRDSPEYRIDPALLAQDQPLYDGGNNYPDPPHPDGVYFGGSHNDDSWQEYGGNQEIDPALQYLGVDQSLDESQIHDPHMDVLRGNQEGWQTLDAGQEFENWMGDE